MALGMKVMIILGVVFSLLVGMAILAGTSQTKPAYDCFMVNHECFESRSPIDIFSKIIPVPH